MFATGLTTGSVASTSGIRRHPAKENITNTLTRHTYKVS